MDIYIFFTIYFYEITLIILYILMSHFQFLLIFIKNFNKQLRTNNDENFNHYEFLPTSGISRNIARTVLMASFLSRLSNLASSS